MSGTNQTVSFQGRLFDTNGSVVPDGYYNIQFKLYQDGSGTTAGNPDGTLKWTESYINNGGTGGVHLKNGYFSVRLGSVTPFGSSVDWNQDTLWLSMNIAGYATACTTFGTAPCAADGEMLPMKRMTAVPQALNSQAVGGKTADNLVQLSQGIQNDSSNNSSIYINKTGTGNLVQLQNTATDVFTITNAGNIRLGSNANHTLSIAASGTDTAGRQLTVSAGDGGSGNGGAGGDLVLQAGAAGASSNAGNGPNALNAQNFEGQTNGTTISTTNTGFDDVFINPSATATFSNEWSVNGTMSGKLTLLALLTKNITSTNVQAMRTYFKVPALPTSTFALAQTQFNGTTTAQVRIDATGRPSIRNAFTTVATSGSSIPTNQSIRLEWKLTGTGSTQEARFFWGANLHGTTPNITISGAYTQGNFNTIDTGISSSTTGFTLYLDEWAHGNDWVGPLIFANGGNLKIDAGSSTTGTAGTIAIGSVNASSITIGSTTTAVNQTISIGANNTAGSTSNVTIGAGSAATAGTTTLQAKDSVSVSTNGSTRASFNSANVQIGDGASTGTPTLLTLDGATSAPTTTLYGSMYYDVTLGKVQCYEADGWGACGAPPDTFVMLSPAYANAVTGETGTGTMSSGFCSDTLNINDGSSGQPTVCGTNETYNFYRWTSSEVTSQTRSIFVTYQLPSNFKNFVAGSTSLKALTNSTNSTVTYQVYRNSSGGLANCGSAVATSTGVQTAWQTGTASGTADPSNCSFVAGDSILIKIDLSANSSANAYVSNLKFAYSLN